MTGPQGSSTQTCSRGCTPAEPDNCQASMVARCPLGFWESDGSEPRWCGHGPGGTCDRGHCYDCDACNCGEDY